MAATSSTDGAARPRHHRPLLACALACVLASPSVRVVDAGSVAVPAHRGSAHRLATLRQARRSLAGNHHAGLHGVGLAQRTPARASTGSTFGRFLRGVTGTPSKRAPAFGFGTAARDPPGSQLIVP